MGVKLKLMLMWVSLLGVGVLGAGCVGGTSSPLTGPSTVPQAAPPASPQPQFFRYVVLALADGIRPSSAWGLAYAAISKGRGTPPSNAAGAAAEPRWNAIRHSPTRSAPTPRWR